MLVGRGMGISRPLVLELVLGGSVCGLLRAQRGRGETCISTWNFAAPGNIRYAQVE